MLPRINGATTVPGSGEFVCVVRDLCVGGDAPGVSDRVFFLETLEARYLLQASWKPSTIAEAVFERRGSSVVGIGALSRFDFLSSLGTVLGPERIVLSGLRRSRVNSQSRCTG